MLELSWIDLGRAPWVEERWSDVCQRSQLVNLAQVLKRLLVPNSSHKWMLAEFALDLVCISIDAASLIEKFYLMGEGSNLSEERS